MSGSDAAGGASVVASASAADPAESAADAALARVLAEGLADVSEAAPDETLAAFRAAPVDQARAAAELLGAGFAATGVETDDSSFAQLILAAAALANSESAEARVWVQLIERRGLHSSSVDSSKSARSSDSGG